VPLTVCISDTASVLTGIVAVTGNVLYPVVHVSNLTTNTNPWLSTLITKQWLNSIKSGCPAASLEQKPALISLETLWFIFCWNTLLGAFILFYDPYMMQTALKNVTVVLNMSVQNVVLWKLIVLLSLRIDFTSSNKYILLFMRCWSVLSFYLLACEIFQFCFISVQLRLFVKMLYFVFVFRILPLFDRDDSPYFIDFISNSSLSAYGFLSSSFCTSMVSRHILRKVKIFYHKSVRIWDSSSLFTKKPIRFSKTNILTFTFFSFCFSLSLEWKCEKCLELKPT